MDPGWTHYQWTVEPEQFYNYYDRLRVAGVLPGTEPGPRRNLSEAELVSTSGTLVRPEEAGILLVVLAIWLGAILLFYSRWKKFSGVEPFTPYYVAEAAQAELEPRKLSGMELYLPEVHRPSLAERRYSIFPDSDRRFSVERRYSSDRGQREERGNNSERGQCGERGQSNERGQISERTHNGKRSSSIFPFPTEPRPHPLSPRRHSQGSHLHTSHLPRAGPRRPSMVLVTENLLQSRRSSCVSRLPSPSIIEEKQETGDSSSG